MDARPESRATLSPFCAKLEKVAAPASTAPSVPLRCKLTGNVRVYNTQTTEAVSEKGVNNLQAGNLMFRRTVTSCAEAFLTTLM